MVGAFLQWVGLAALVGYAWRHGRSIGIRIGAARYQDTIEEREEMRLADAADAASQPRGIRLHTIQIGRDTTFRNPNG